MNSSNNRYFLAILIVLSLAAAIPLAGVVRADNDVSRGPDEGQLSADEEGTYRVQVAAYFSSRRAKKAKKKIEKDDRFKGQKAVIEFSAKSGVYRVEIGEFRTTGEAEALQAQFIEAGYDDAEVVVDRLYPGGPPALFPIHRPMPRWSPWMPSRWKPQPRQPDRNGPAPTCR